MGLPKIQHIRELLTMPEVNEQFTARYQRDWTEEDVVELNRLFEKYLFASLKEYTDPIPGVIPTLEKLRAEGLKIGSTTGYTREMMDVVQPAAEANVRLRTWFSRISQNWACRVSIPWLK